MPIMSMIESAFCRSTPWRSFSRGVVLPWVLAGRSLHGEVLEIGGGSGAMAAGIASRFPEARITVTDVDPLMVDAARTRLAGHVNVGVEVADVSSLPFPSGRFDAVTSCLMLHHVIDWRDALAEAARVLTPGGALVGYDLTDTRLARWIHKADGSPHLLIAADELSRGLAVAGFDEISVRRSAVGHLMRFRAHKPHEG